MLSIIIGLVLAAPVDCQECKAFGSTVIEKRKTITRSKIFGRRKSGCK